MSGHRKIRRRHWTNRWKCPYLSQKPDTIDIRVGRQLFVDDFLIAETDLVRVEGKPETQPQPLLQPETEMELNSGYCTCACPFNGGVFYDPQSAAYKNVVSGRLVRWQRLCGKQGWPALETFA